MFVFRHSSSFGKDAGKLLRPLPIDMVRPAAPYRGHHPKFEGFSTREAALK